MSRIFTVLLAGGRGQRLDPLTRDRAKPAVPFGGTYRIVDFTLSNCVNSGFTQVLTLVQYRSRSLNEHIRMGWTPFFSNAKGDFIETLPPQQNLGDRWYAGTADAVHQNLFAVKEERPEIVVILSGDHIYKMDYRDLLKTHLETGAEVTVAAVEVPRSEASSFGVLQVDDQYRVLSFTEKPKDPEPIPGDPQNCLASMGIYAFRAETLYSLLDEDARDLSSSHDFGKDIIPKLIGRLPVQAFRFIDRNRKRTKYWRDVGTIDAYYAANMDLVEVDPLLNLYDADWPVYRRATMAAPPKFVFAEDGPGGRFGAATDSLVAPGCILSGGRVHHSILSPNCRIHGHALVEHSILFDDVEVGRGAKIRRAIIDKHVRIPEGMRIGHDLDNDRKLFTVSADGIVVIQKGAIL